MHRTFRIEPLSAHESRHAWADGFCDCTQDLIRVNLELTEPRVFEILIHEVAHAVHTVAGLSDESSEEDFTLRATPVWLCVWRDNPQLAELLWEFVTGE